MQVYNDEHLYHFGIPGMKWRHHKIQQLKKYNDGYKTKVNKIANSKTANKSDIKMINKVNKSITSRIGTAATSAIVGTLVKDFLSGDIKKYGSMSSAELLKKVTDIGKSTTTSILKDEVLARSVANKYDTNGMRIKGSNKSRFTREQVVTTGIDVASFVGPIIGKLGFMKLSQMQEKKRAGEAAFNRWGGRVLSDKRSDYSHIIPNVNYTVS